MATRRQILTWSLGSAALLSGGTVGFQWLQEEDFSRLSDQSLKLTFFTHEDALLLASIIPTIVGPSNMNSWRAQKLTLIDLISKMDIATLYMSQHTRDGLRELFDLLWSRFGKLLLAGIWTTWSNASISDVDDFLSDWRNSWVGELTDGYLGLQQLVFGTLLTEPGLWADFGYGGPPW